MTAIDINAMRRELYGQGYTILPAFFSEAECRWMSELMDEHWRRSGSPPMQARERGFMFNPILSVIPTFAPLLDQPWLMQLAREVIGDEVRLISVGGRISNENTVEQLSWHHHYDWNPEGLPGRKKIERIQTSIYCDGTFKDIGPLVLLPRRFDEPIGSPSAGLYQSWEREHVIEVPIGSIVIWDSPLWHTARRGLSAGRRHAWGAHYQGWRETRPHSSDNLVDVPEIAVYKQKHPGLRALLDPH
jgi:hypothetical protein